jgi:hypothetical protein
LHFRSSFDFLSEFFGDIQPEAGDEAGKKIMGFGEILEDILLNIVITFVFFKLFQGDEGFGK